MLDTELRLRLAKQKEEKEAAEHTWKVMTQTLGTVACAVVAYHAWGWWGLLGLLGYLWRFTP
jgi:hypothetical protein